MHCNREIFESAAKGTACLSTLLNMEVAEGWSSLRTKHFRHVLDTTETDSAADRWSTYLVIDKEKQMLIGNGGFKGAPHGQTIEIGYSISPSFRNRGCATEFVGLLIDYAFSYAEINKIIARTMPQHYSSIKVLEKNGFRQETTDYGSMDIRTWALFKI